MLEDGSAPASLELITLLKSCGAFEPFRRQPRAQLRAGEVAEYLLLNPQFPRAVLFCLERIAARARGRWRRRPCARRRSSIRRPGWSGGCARTSTTSTCRRCSSPASRRCWRTSCAACTRSATRSRKTYFNTRVILPTPRSAAAARTAAATAAATAGARVRLRITHTTTFRYDVPVSEAYMEMRLTPLDAGGQRCESFRLTTDPPGEVRSYVDRFGNGIRHFDTLNPHDRLVVSARSEVSTPEAFVDPERELSLLDAFDYLQPTPYAPDSEAVRAFARGLRRSRRRGWRRPRPSLKATHEALAYTPGSTTVKTTADEALGAGRGVCQDFAHLMIAACRVLGLPARYVSGYVFAPRRGHGGRLARLDGRLRSRPGLDLAGSHPRLRADRSLRPRRRPAATTRTSRPPAASTRARARKRWRWT